MVSSKINVFEIIKKQYATYRSNRTEKTSFADLFTFFGIPIILSFVMFSRSVHLDDQIGNLLTIVSIFGGFLFNLMAIVHNLISEAQEKFAKQPESKDPFIIKESKTFKTVLDEINTNISYNVLVSLVLVALMLVFLEIFPYWGYIPVTCHIFEIIVCILLFHFGFNMLMILKRIFILLQPRK